MKWGVRPHDFVSLGHFTGSAHPSSIPRPTFIRPSKRSLLLYPPFPDMSVSPASNVTRTGSQALPLPLPVTQRLLQAYLQRLVSNPLLTKSITLGQLQPVLFFSLAKSCFAHCCSRSCSIGLASLIRLSYSPTFLRASPAFLPTSLHFPNQPCPTTCRRSSQPTSPARHLQLTRLKPKQSPSLPRHPPRRSTAFRALLAPSARRRPTRKPSLWQLTED